MITALAFAPEKPRYHALSNRMTDLGPVTTNPLSVQRMGTQLKTRYRLKGLGQSNLMVISQPQCWLPSPFKA